MREIAPRYIQQESSGCGERWFSDEHHDLFVWLSPAGKVLRFHFCYGKGSGREEIVRWAKGVGLRHALVDDGEPGYGKMTPIVVANGPWSPRLARKAFHAAGREIPAGIFLQVDRALARSARKAPGHHLSGATPP